jgi:hypothetical protein
MVHGIVILLICGQKQIGFETEFVCILLFTSWVSLSRYRATGEQRGYQLAAWQVELPKFPFTITLSGSGGTALASE